MVRSCINTHPVLSYTASSQHVYSLRSRCFSSLVYEEWLGDGRLLWHDTFDADIGNSFSLNMKGERNSRFTGRTFYPTVSCSRSSNTCVATCTGLLVHSANIICHRCKSTKSKSRLEYQNKYEYVNRFNPLILTYYWNKFATIAIGSTCNYIT